MGKWVHVVAKNMKSVTLPAKTVTTVASPLIPAPIKENDGVIVEIRIQSRDGRNATVYWGDSTVTPLNGQILRNNGGEEGIRVFDPNKVWVVTASGTSDLRIRYV